MCVCAPHACLVSKTVRTRYQIPGNWSYKQSLVAMWVLGIEHRSSGRAAAGAHNYCPVSSTPERLCIVISVPKGCDIAVAAASMPVRRQ